MNRKLIIGLAGGIGSGKSTVASLFAEAGAAVIDSDALNQAQLRDKEVVETVESWWGPSVRDASGVLDRQKIASIIFADPEQRSRLEQLVHPRIAAQRERLIEAYGRNPDIRAIVLDTPLLTETGLDERCDVVVYIDADAEIRRRRVIANRGWTDEAWREREKSQNALDKKRAKADHVLVNNSSDLVELRSAVRNLLSRLELDT